MADLSELAEMEHDEPEFIPEIVPVDARLSVSAPVDVLQALFSRAVTVTPKLGKEIVPGTAYALLEAVQASSSESAYLRITASDGEQTVSVVEDAVTVLMAGSVLVPPHRIHDILKLAPSKTAKLEVIGTTAHIRSSQALWTVQTPVGDTLDVLSNVDGIKLWSVAVLPFVNAVSIARAAASANSAWLGLNQLLIRNSTITGCDGGRLHRASVKPTEGLVASADLTIPVKVVDEVLKALRTYGGFFEMGWDATRLVFRIGEDYIVAHRLLEPFPNIENLLLAPVFSNVNSLTVDRNELREVIKRVRVNSDPDTSAIHLVLQPAKDQTWRLAVRARDRSGNGSQEVIQCQWVGPEKPRQLVVNHHYLSDFLDAYKAETVIFKIGENTRTKPSPLFIEDTDLGFTGVVQQMHSAW